jgi:hypothetical protein
MWTIAYIAELSKFDQLMPVFDKSINTFRLTP